MTILRKESESPQGGLEISRSADVQAGSRNATPLLCCSAGADSLSVDINLIGFIDRVPINMRTFKALPSTGKPHGDDNAEQTHHNHRDVVHGLRLNRQGGRHADENTENNNPGDGKPVAEVSEPAEVKVASREFISALGEKNSLFALVSQTLHEFRKLLT